MNETLRDAVLERLSHVTDPETGADVVRMRLIEDLTVDEAGVARYRFRPSSPLCPIAIPLAFAIYKAVAEIEGITGQEVEVVDYIGAEELSELLREAERARREKEAGAEDR